MEIKQLSLPADSPALSVIASAAKVAAVNLPISTVTDSSTPHTLVFSNGGTSMGAELYEAAKADFLRCDGAPMDTSLYKAAINGDFEMFKNYDLAGLLGIKKDTVLHIHLNSPAARSKDFVEKVLGQSPKLLWQVNNNGDTPLHIAAKHRHQDIVKFLIEQAKKPIDRDPEMGLKEEAACRMLRMVNKQNETALHLAIKVNSLPVVEEILEHEDPKYTYTANIFQETPLYIAIDRWLDAIAIKVLEKFELPACSGPNGRTAFHPYGYHCYRLSVNNYNRLSDLMLSKLGSSVNKADESGWTPLHYAVCYGSNETVARILEKDKSSAYAIDKEGKRTALHLASCAGAVETMEVIIDQCPECCDITDEKGWNVLHYAAVSYNWEEAVKTILKHSSLAYLVYGMDIKGYTPLHLLEASGNNLLSLESWIQDGLSGLPSKIYFNEKFSILFCPSSPLASKDDSCKRQILEWMKDIGRNPLGDTINVWIPPADTSPELEKLKDSHLVAAALVATVTFAAAFTVPGGYISDGNDAAGTAILSRNAAFEAFVVSNAIAMVLSTSAVFMHFLMAAFGYTWKYGGLVASVICFILVAMGAMVVAFVTGTYAVLAEPSLGLAIAICVIGLSFFVQGFYTYKKLYNM